MDPDIFPNLCVSIITELDEWDATCMGLNERPTINDITVREDEKEGSIYIEDGALWVEYPWPGILETVNIRKLETLQELAEEEGILFDPYEKCIAVLCELDPEINPFIDLYSEKKFLQQVEQLVRSTGTKWAKFYTKMLVFLRN
ncbi:MAG: hypothetical protein ACFFC7_17675 [Candidatus Hermodarchaeota archaeon]